MGKDKLRKFKEVAEFSHVIQPDIGEIFNKKHRLFGKWKTGFFQNNQPLVLELGCGKGEYTVGLAKLYPDKNFLGIDIKGARIWKGANESFQLGLKNVGFLRIRIEFINSFFNNNEVDEIWITFPDPQLKKRRNKKRLTAARYLNSYKQFLTENGFIHLKTDNEVLFDYTLELVKFNNLPVIRATKDLYNELPSDEILSIKTYYESQFLAQGMKINYLKFQLSGPNPIIEPENEE